MKRERAMMLYSTAKILKADIYLVSAHTPIRLVDNARIELQIWTRISFLFQVSRHVRYLLDPNSLCRSLAKSGLYDF